MQMLITRTSSRHVNMHRSVRHNRTAPKVYDRLDEIQAEVEGLKPLSRKRTKAEAARFRSCIRAICLDLYHAHMSDPEMEIGVIRGHTSLTKNPAYPIWVTAKQFLAALDGLQTTGYVVQLSLGNEASGKSTRVRATTKLATKLRVEGFSAKELLDTSELIRLAFSSTKNGPKKRRPYIDTNETKQWRKSLEEYNAYLSRYFIWLDQSAEEFVQMEEQRRLKAVRDGEAYQKISMHKTRMHRQFTSPDFKAGGRFYGPWWQHIRKEDRKFIKINRKDTCEHDYSSIHPMLIYSMCGLSRPIDYDHYSAPHGPRNRALVKKAFNIMLNASVKIKKSQIPEFSEEATQMTWQAFVTGIEREHKDIAHYFYTGLGVRLQRSDADIAEAVMGHLKAMGYPCLPVHDSFITIATLSDELPMIMQDVVKRLYDVDIGVKAKDTHTSSGAGGLVANDIEQLLNNPTSMDKAWHEFLEMREEQNNIPPISDGIAPQSPLPGTVSEKEELLP